MRPYYNTLLKRHEANPLIVPADFPHGPADAVFNCGQTMMGGTTILLTSVVFADGRPPNIYVARSEDGLDFTFDDEPLFERCELPGIRELDRHIIDPRVTKIGEAYYIVRPTGSVAVGLMYKTKDFKSVEFIDCIALAHNRVPCLFPEKIGGYYWKIDRPSIGKPPDNQGDMWISRSPDLIHWGHYRPLLGRFGPWGGHKIGPTPPIRTEAGWLEIIHGVTRSCSTTRYSLGAVLLDLEDPEKGDRADGRVPHHARDALRDSGTRPRCDLQLRGDRGPGRAAASGLLRRGGYGNLSGDRRPGRDHRGVPTGRLTPMDPPA